MKISRQKTGQVFYKLLENGSHYRVSELIPCIFGVFKHKIERKGEGGGTEQHRQIYKFTQGYITFSTDYNYTTNPYHTLKAFTRQCKKEM